MVGRPSRRLRRGRGAVRKFQKWLVGHLGGPEVVVSPTLEIRQWSKGPPNGPKMVGKLCRKSKSGRRPPRRSGSGREALSKVWECSGGYTGGPRVVRRPSGRFGVVRRPAQRFVSGREAIREVRE